MSDILRGLKNLLSLTENQGNKTYKYTVGKTGFNAGKPKSKRQSIKDKLLNQLPVELHPYLDNIVHSKLQFVNITLEKSNGSYLQSKVGGHPYFPEEMEYPADSNGNPLDFLAQINFAEVPKLEGYPDHGILQFYIALNDLYGLDFSNRKEQKDYRVIYHEVPGENPRKDFYRLDEIRKSAEYMSPKMSEDEYLMRFNMDAAYVSPHSIHFGKFFNTKDLDFFAQFGEREDEVMEVYNNLTPSLGHKIGGYPFFTQDDPRMYDESIKDWVLLFQLDTDKSIMWGDSGIGNFFISKEDLKKADFSKVYYNWDCC